MSRIICYRVLIIVDSRVRNLPSYLNKTSLNLLFEVESLPGAALENLFLRAMILLSYEKKFDLIILAGGINSITGIGYQPSRHATLR